MSLLLDALKRAEQEKLARHDRTEPEPAGAQRPSGPPPAPQAGLELQPISSPAAANNGAAKPPPGAHAAQVVFQAKTAPAANEPRSRSMLVGTAVGAVLIVVIAAGAYVWHTLRTLTPAPMAQVRQPSAATSAPPAGAPPNAAPSSPPVFVPREPEPSSAAGTRSAPTPQPGSPSPGSTASPAAPPAPPRAAEVAVTQPSRAGESSRALQEVLRESTARPSTVPPLRLERSAEPPRVPRDIVAGYESLTRGDVAAARRSYQAALAADAGSIDALLGMATVEAQSANRGGAAMLYRRVLEIDSRNVTAIAGLAALADHSRPEALEAQLREDLTRHPESAQLRFALGNLYASQSRWTEAQAEFFEAYRLDPAAADVLYNLAVSLDHLGQSRLAAEFYGRALQASRRQATQFDPAPVARRLAELGG